MSQHDLLILLFSFHTYLPTHSVLHWTTFLIITCSYHATIALTNYYYYYYLLCFRIYMIFRCPTFPADGAVALDDPECLFQLVAVSEQVKQTLSVVGTVAQVYNDISGRDTLVAVRSLEPACHSIYGTFIALSLTIHTFHYIMI